MTGKQSRRTFLSKSAQVAAGALAIPTLVPSSVFGKYAPSNRITVGMIGAGRQAYGANLPQLLKIPEIQVVSVCDTDSWRMEEMRKSIDAFYGLNTSSGKTKMAKTNKDFRALINNDEIDVLMISTPDHWHVPIGVMAAKAGKDFAIEKPLSLCIAHGRALSDAVKNYNVVTRIDSEFRSIKMFSRLAELIRNGRLGKLQHIEIGLPSDPPAIPSQPDMPVPDELDYEMWLGPAPYAPYTTNRVHSRNDLKSRPGWMRISTYANGMIANWGAHLFDIVQWANNSEHTGPVQIEGKGEFPKSLWNTPVNFDVDYTYSNGVTMNCHMEKKYYPYVKFTGSEGWALAEYGKKMIASSDKILNYHREEGEISFDSVLGDKEDFIQSVKSRKPTLEPLEVGHRTVSIAQLGLIAMTLEGKLQWDPVKERFTNDNAANALLGGIELRSPWKIV